MSGKRQRRRRATISMAAFQGGLVLVAIIGGFGLLLSYNVRPLQSFDVPSGQLVTMTPTSVNWQGLIATQFLLDTTPIPTADAAEADAYEPPTPDWIDITPAAFEPAQIVGVSTPTPSATPQPGGPTATPTAGPSPTPTVTPLIPAALATATPRSEWNPPEMNGPLALTLRDHFWLRRPIKAGAVNYGAQWYHYGSNGLDDNLRVHRGEDFGNPRGVEVLAAADGTVIWADYSIRTTRWINGREYPEEITTYGNVIVIEHDFSYRGQTVYTLYAHLEQFIAQVGDRVEAGDVIGLVGATGVVGGPHLHLEVRVGWNSYSNTRNPYLWLAPYVGHGVIAGRLTYEDGVTFVEDNGINLIDKSTGRLLRQYTTYGPGVNPDDEWNENFVFGDVPAGEYQVVTYVRNERQTVDVMVYPGRTSFIDMQAEKIDEPAATPHYLPTATASPETPTATPTSEDS